MPIAQRVAISAVVLLGLVMALQVLLAAGLPLGRAAWGGRHRVLPRRLRWASLAAAILVGIAAQMIVARAGLAPGGEATTVRIGVWVFAGFFALNTLANLASPSRVERYLMAPVTLLLLACFVIVGLSSR